MSNNTIPEKEINQTSEEEQAKILKEIAKQEKIKKSLLWFGIFSIIMLFAGVTSGFIVAKDSNFWVVLNLPRFFMWSTIVVVLSSLLLYFASVKVKQEKNKIAGTAIGLALALGLFFGFSQYEGFMELSRKGSAINAGIINLEGRYGEYFTLSVDDKELTFDGENYIRQGQEINKIELAEIKVFLNQFLNVKTEKEIHLKNYEKFQLKFQNSEVAYSNNSLTINGEKLSAIKRSKLYHFAEAIISERGDFYMIGKYGEDFSVKYKGKPIEYANRKFYKNGQELSAYVFSELSSADNRASSFILAFIVLHALHWIAGIIVLLVLLINTLRNKYSPVNSTGLKIGSIYWHFLGILWIYLYVFLNFIH